MPCHAQSIVTGLTRAVVIEKLQRSFQVRPYCKKMQEKTKLLLSQDCDQVLGRERSRVSDSQLSGPWQAMGGQRVLCAFKQAVHPEHPNKPRCLHVSLCGDRTLQQKRPVRQFGRGCDPWSGSRCKIRYPGRFFRTH